MAGGAANGAKQHLARAHRVVDRAPSGRREKFHERFEVVDPAPPCSPIRLVFRIGDPVAQLHLLRRDAECELVRKEIVRNPHLVPVGVGAERQERRVLGLPPEPSDAAPARGDVGDDGRSPADAVAVAIAGIVEREQRFVGDRFDEARAKQRDGHASGDHVRLWRNDRLTRVQWESRRSGTATLTSGRARRTRRARRGGPP